MQQQEEDIQHHPNVAGPYHRHVSGTPEKRCTRGGHMMQAVNMAVQLFGADLSFTRIKSYQGGLNCMSICFKQHGLPWWGTSIVHRKQMRYRLMSLMELKTRVQYAPPAPTVRIYRSRDGRTRRYSERPHRYQWA